MNLALAVLLATSLGMAFVLLLSVSHRYSRALRGPRARRAIGLGQLGVGLGWVVWGTVALARHEARAGFGWYAVLLGGLWTLQAVRRLSAR